MSYTIEDLEQQAKRVHYDLTAAKAKLSELERMIAWLVQRLPDEAKAAASFICPKCGLTKVTAELLADHLANVHGEDVPVREVA